MGKFPVAMLKLALLALAELFGVFYIFLSKEKINLAFSSDYGYIFAMVVLMTVCTSFELKLLKELKQA